MSLLKDKLRESFKGLPIELYDSNKNLIYLESSDGYWIKRECDNNNNELYCESSNGYWHRSEYDSNNNEIYYKNSKGSWIKKEYDKNNNEIYFETSCGIIIDKRPKTINRVKQRKAYQLELWPIIRS